MFANSHFIYMNITTARSKGGEIKSTNVEYDIQHLHALVWV